MTPEQPREERDERALDTPLGAKQRRKTQRRVANVLRHGDSGSATPPHHHEQGAKEQGEERVIFHCRGCGKTAESSRELLAQGCEGTHEPYVPLAALEAAEQEVERLREGLRELADAAVGLGVSNTRTRDAVANARDLLASSTPKGE